MLNEPENWCISLFRVFLFLSLPLATSLLPPSQYPPSKLRPLFSWTSSVRSSRRTIVTARICATVVCALLVLQQSRTRRIRAIWRFYPCGISGSRNCRYRFNQNVDVDRKSLLAAQIVIILLVSSTFLFTLRTSSLSCSEYFVTTSIHPCSLLLRDKRMYSLDDDYYSPTLKRRSNKDKRIKWDEIICYRFIFSHFSTSFSLHSSFSSPVTFENCLHIANELFFTSPLSSQSQYHI